MDAQITVTLSSFLDQAVAAIRAMTGCSDIALVDVDVVSPLPAVSGELGARVIVEDDGFRIERRGVIHVVGRFVTGVSAKAPTLWSLHMKGEASDYVELAPEHARATRAHHMHPTMLAEALGDAARIGSVTLGRRCGAWCWVHVEQTNEGETVVLYDHDGEIVMRFDGVERARVHAIPTLKRAANG